MTAASRRRILRTMTTDELRKTHTEANAKKTVSAHRGDYVAATAFEDVAADARRELTYRAER